MYTPSLRVKNNGVPILSKAEIDAIGERFVQDFQPEVLTNPSPVDIEGFIEFYLGMTPDYQYLSHNGVYLGVTVFNDTNKVPVFDPATNRAEYISAKARTVIIDNRLDLMDTDDGWDFVTPEQFKAALTVVNLNDLTK